MLGRRTLLVFPLLLVLTSQAGAASDPLIIQLPAAANITSIANALGAKIVDRIPETNTFLLNVPMALPGPVAAVLGLAWAELNQSVTQPGFARAGVLPLPHNAQPDWYKYQPAMLLIRARNALSYSTGRGIVIADINSKVDVAHPALVGHLTSGYAFVEGKPAGTAALSPSSAGFIDEPSASFMDQSSATSMAQSSASFVDQSSASFMHAGNPAYSHGTLCAGIIAAIAPDS